MHAETNFPGYQDVGGLLTFLIKTNYTLPLNINFTGLSLIVQECRVVSFES